MDQRTIEHVFKYHPPSCEQLAKYEAIRQAGKNLATVIAATTPNGSDQEAAINSVRIAVMQANSAIACHQGYEDCASPMQPATDSYDPRKVG